MISMTSRSELLLANKSVERNGLQAVLANTLRRFADPASPTSNVHEGPLPKSSNFRFGSTAATHTPFPGRFSLCAEPLWSRQSAHQVNARDLATENFRQAQLATGDGGTSGQAAVP